MFIRTILLLLSFGALSFYINGDVPKFFDIERVDNSTKIVAYGDFVDENGKDFNFIIEKQDEIKEFISEIKYGGTLSNVFSDESIEVHLVQDYRDVTSLTIVPKYKRVFANDGHSYQFDLGQLEAWRKKYKPLKYRFISKEFKDKGEFEMYLNDQKKNPNFLYSTRPGFRYEGSFEMQFPANGEFKNPQAVMDYLKPFIEKIEPDEKKYGMSYILNDKNFNNRDQYTLTISGNKRLFDDLKVENYEKSNWAELVELVLFYYKK